MRKIDIGTVKRTLAGEKICGDDLAVIETEYRIIAALADGLGHGEKAAEASAAFCDFVKKNPSMSAIDIVVNSQKSLAGTRGAAAAVCVINPHSGSMQFCGVGNVELVCAGSSKIRPISTPGILGRNVRKTLQFDYSLSSGDVIAIFSDGISNRFSLETYAKLGAKEMAETILKNHGKTHDDASCIVIKF